MDRVGQDVDGRARLDGEDGLADRVSRPGGGDERPQQNPLTTVHHDRHVTGRLGNVTRRGRRVVGRLLERVEAAVARLLELEPDPEVWGSV